MSENLQNLLRDALLNNSYDYDSMHITLSKTWKNSYSYLYELQKAYVEYEELFYYSNDDISHNSKLMGKLYLDEMLYANFDVEYDLIHVYTRELFRRSKFYLKPFTFEDMINNPEIFLKIPVVIIDNQVIWDYKVQVGKDITTFTLPYKRQFVIKNERDPETDDIIYVDHKVQVLVIDNIFYQRLTLNKSNIYHNAITKTISIKKDLLKKIPKQDGTMMCTIHFPNSAGRGYEMGTQLIPLDKDQNGDYVASITDDINKQLHESNRDFFVSMVFFNRLYQHTFYDNTTVEVASEKGARLMVIQESEMVPYKTPIPVEDFMIFKKAEGTDGYILEKNIDMLEMHYPNIYRFKDENMNSGDMYKVYYFYYNAYDLQYTVLFDFYFQFLIDTFSNTKIEKIINDIYYDTADYKAYTEEQKEKFKKVFKKIFDYQYFHHNYGESDFLNRYLHVAGNGTKEPIEYKDETLKDWIKVQPWVLRDYVLDQHKLGASYHLFTNTLDLPSRLRTSTEMEMGEKSQEFDEPRYVFAFNNEKEYPILLEARVFVDGIIVMDVYQERKYFMDYFYIPASMVTDDSYIEIEIFPQYEFSKEVTFENIDDEKDITIVEPEDTIFPTVADLYVEDENGLRAKPKLFQITSCYDRGNFEVKTTDPKKPVVFTRLNHFKIKPNSEFVLNTPMKIKFTKTPNAMLVLIDKTGFPYLEFVEKNFNHHKDYIRVYRNGRLLSRNKYRFLSSFKCPRMMLLEKYNAGDYLFIDVTPYRYTEVYYQEEISQETTLIDLRKIINKPFDIRYYDVYMNGRKLSLNNVFSITPWEITLVNLKSNYNLAIYEKERDWEYFGLDYTKNIYYFSFDDLLNSGIVSEDEKNKLIKDIIDKEKDERLNIYPNTNDEKKEDWSKGDETFATINIFYYYELIPKTYVNPDRRQFDTDVLMEEFPEIYENYIQDPRLEARDEIEAARKANFLQAVCLDPDIRFVGSNPDHPQYTYAVGHLGEVDEKLLKQAIVINNEPNIK